MLGCNRFYFLPPPSHAIYLVSGLVHFLNDISPLINTKKGTYVTNKYYRYRQRLPSLPLNLNCYFPVPKGADDIRVVFNETSCGLNNNVFASSFWLPMSNTMTRLLSFGYRVVDIDIGEKFLNFPLYRTLQSCSGVDLTPFRPYLTDVIPVNIKKNARLAAVWTRLWFGFRSSPELSSWRICKRWPTAINNPLRWDQVILNIIGNKYYNPTFPHVYKCS